MLTSDRAYKLAVLTIALIAAYFSLQSLVKGDYFVLTSPAPNQEVVGSLVVDGEWIRMRHSFSVAIETPSGTRTYTTLPVVEDVRGWEEGTYHVAVKVFGKVAMFTVLSQVVTGSFTVDNSPPEILVTGFPNEGVVHATCEFHVEVLDGVLENVLIDDVVELPATRGTSATVRMDTASLSEGSHELRIRAIDAVGQQGECRLAFSSDNAGPKITSLGPAEDIPLRGYVRVTPVIDELTLTGLECWIDGALVVQTDTRRVAFDTADFSPGFHSVRVRAHDLFGQVGEYSGIVTIDRRVPELMFSLSPDRPDVPSRRVLVDGADWDEANATVRLFTGTPGDQVSVSVFDTYADGKSGSLEMTFELEETVATLINRTFGQAAAEPYALAASILARILWGYAQFSGASIEFDPYLLPSFTNLSECYAFGVVRFGVWLPVYELGMLRLVGKNGGGMYLRLTLEQLLALADMTTETSFEDMASLAKLSGRFAYLALEIGSLSSTYEWEILESETKGKTRREVVQSRTLSGSWLRAVYSMGRKLPADLPLGIWLEMGASLNHWHDLAETRETTYLKVPGYSSDWDAILRSEVLKSHQEDWWDISITWALRVTWGG